MDDITSDLPEEAYPGPKFCRQCGHQPPATGYVICAACHKKNIAYDAKIAKMRIEYEFVRDPTTKQKNSRSRGNGGFGNKRKREIAAFDNELEHSEQNTRTEYHGDNYLDE